MSMPDGHSLTTTYRQAVLDAVEDRSKNIQDVAFSGVNAVAAAVRSAHRAEFLEELIARFEDEERPVYFNDRYATHDIGDVIAHQLRAMREENIPDD